MMIKQCLLVHLLNYPASQMNIEDNTISRIIQEYKLSIVLDCSNTKKITILCHPNPIVTSRTSDTKCVHQQPAACTIAVAHHPMEPHTEMKPICTEKIDPGTLRT